MTTTEEWTQGWTSSLLSFFIEEGRYPNDSEWSQIKNRLTLEFTDREQWYVLEELIKTCIGLGRSITGITENFQTFAKSMLEDTKSILGDEE